MIPIEIIPVVIIIIYLLSSIKILREYERGVIFRLGRVLPSRKARACSWCLRRSTASCESHRGSKRWRSRPRM